MTETYCGKSCEGCEYREQLRCKGCKNGPGYLLTCECELAKCCAKKNCDTCEACSQSASCWKYHAREYAAKNRLMNRNAEKQRFESKSRALTVLSQWVWVLFWILIVQNVVDFLDGSELFAENTAVTLILLILRQVLCLAYGLVFLKMSKQSSHYKTAAITMFILVGYNLLKHYAISPGLSMLSDLLTLPALGLSFFGLYHEYMGHSEVTQPFDRQLSEKWDRLWKWNIGAYAGRAVSFVIMILFDVWLGLLLVIIALVVLLILGIVAAVLLYRSAELFRTQKAVLSLREKSTSARSI